MTLPPASTAPKAIGALTDLIRRGVRVYRSARAKECREHYLPQLKRLYEEEVPEPIAMGGGDPLLLKSRQVLKCQLGKSGAPDLPATWGAVIYEEYNWPTGEFDPEEPRQPFSLFLRIQRGPYKFVLPIHDERERWLVPQFKVRLRFLKFPMSPAFHIGTFFVYRDGLTTPAMCQWLTTILAQRSLLTEEEEAAAIQAYFAPGGERGLSARLAAYERLKRTFVQPTGGWISFPALYQKTVRQFLRDDPDRVARRNTSDDHPAPYHSLRQLRRQEPALHRALLDRIQRGTVKAVVIENERYVSIHDSNRVDEERKRNAESRIPLQFPGKRTEWARRLSTRGIKYKSAQRQVKRWINDLQLSEAEINASVTRGRLVRIPPSRK